MLTVFGPDTPYKPLGSEARGQVSPDWPGQESVPSSEQQGTGRRGAGMAGRLPPGALSSRPSRVGSSQPTGQQCFGQIIFPGALPPGAPGRKQSVMEPVMQPRLCSFNDSSAARHGHTPPREPSPPRGPRPAPAPEPAGRAGRRAGPGEHPVGSACHRVMTPR